MASSARAVAADMEIHKHASGGRASIVRCFSQKVHCFPMLAMQQHKGDGLAHTTLQKADNSLLLATGLCTNSRHTNKYYQQYV
jgi:hypothetical protein